MQELFSLRGRTALVTGGSRGLGRMIAEGLLTHGAKVYVSSRKSAVCEETAAALGQFGECIALAADVATTAGIEALSHQFSEREQSLDILIHNAGAVWTAQFNEFPESGWDKVVGLNLKAPFFITKALYPLLRKAGETRCAKVINIASVDGISVNPLDTYSYAASKAGLVHLTKRLALRLIKDNIAVSCIAPGEFPSEMNREARDQPEKAAARVPAGRIGAAQDIAGAAVYLASRAGDYVVGGTITVDGGLSIARG